MSIKRAGMQVALRPALGRRTVWTTAAEPYDTLKAKIRRFPVSGSSMYRHSAFLNAREKSLNDVWLENAIFFYSLALTPFLVLYYLE
ncbi:hypothetical protein DIPPA_17125 [Diplonema papillatum]|nr:hypothetical protein DIPPA_17125 [Diplonema papillatum]KAJ9473658.1 hypothetical protein DIPPA_17125 [Diplonema papillatum]